MELSEVLTLIDRAGTIGLLIVIVFGGWRGVYVWARELNEMREDRDWWRQVALDGLTAAEKSLDLHDRTRRRAP